MARAPFSCLALLVVGCANPTGSNVQPHLDFSFETGGSDLSVAGDLATPPPAPDLGVPDLGQSGDFAVSVDLEAEPDLRLPGAGSCDLGAATAHRLWFAGVANGNVPFLARFHPSTGWQNVTMQGGHTAKEIALALLSGQPLVALRAGNDAVETTLFEGCLDLFPAPTQIGASALTLARPVVLGGVSADLVFRGEVAGDQRLYHSQSGGALTWSAPAVQGNFLSTVNPAAVRYTGGVHAVIAGTNLSLYEGALVDANNGGTTTQIGGAGQLTSLHRPRSSTGAAAWWCCGRRPT